MPVREIILLNPPEGKMAKTKRFKKARGGYGYVVDGRFASKAEYDKARKATTKSKSTKSAKSTKAAKTTKTVKASPAPGKKKVEHKVVKKTRRSSSGKLFNACYLKRNPGVFSDFVAPGLIALGAVGTAMLLAGYLDVKVIGTPKTSTKDGTGLLKDETTRPAYADLIYLAAPAAVFLAAPYLFKNKETGMAVRFGAVVAAGIAGFVKFVAPKLKDEKTATEVGMGQTILNYLGMGEAMITVPDWQRPADILPRDTFADRLRDPARRRPTPPPDRMEGVETVMDQVQPKDLVTAMSEQLGWRQDWN